VVPTGRRDAAPRDYLRSFPSVNASRPSGDRRGGRILVFLAPKGSDRLAARAGRQLSRIDPRSDRPHGLVRLGVVACVALSVAVGLVYFVKAVDTLGGDASANAASTFDDRVLSGGIALGVDQEALIQARGLIPERGTYRLAVAPGATNIGQFARYLLMPRRPAPDARWVLCYGCDLSSFGDKLHVVWQNDAGAAVGRLPG
jgi:hypothetical protein